MKLKSTVFEALGFQDQRIPILNLSSTLPLSASQPLPFNREISEIFQIFFPGITRNSEFHSPDVLEAKVVRLIVVVNLRCQAFLWRLIILTTTSEKIVIKYK